MTGRRTVALVVVVGAIALPAAMLQVLCVGRACDRAPSASRVPFCPLDADLKQALENGYYEGRSPDVLGVSGAGVVYTDVDGLGVPWPAVGSGVDPRVPLAFAGQRIAAGAAIPVGTTLDRVAPTIAEALGFDRAFDNVRSGTSVASAIGTSDPPRLVLLVAWKGVGSADLRDRPAEWPFLASLVDEGTGTLEAETGSLPLDPTATLTTIGTGGLPRQHGITGASVRDDDGDVVPAFGTGAPVHVIATLADDLDHADPRTRVALVGGDERDLGLIGGRWYPRQDPVDVVLGDRRAAALAVDVHLANGYGADDVPDVIGVVLTGDVAALDRSTRRIVTAARQATDGSVLVVVAGTGSEERHPLAMTDDTLIDAVERAVPGEAVAAVVPGGIYLDRRALTDAGVTGQVAVDALLRVTDADGRAMMTDAFQGFAVSFARYC